MDKRGAVIFWVSTILAVLLIAATFLYFALFKVDNQSVYAGQEIKNPALGLTNEQAVTAFDEGFVFYLLYNIKAYDLHNPPLSSDNPRIVVDVGDEVFSATVKKGIIDVSRERIAKEDIIIKTTKEEAVKMIRDKSYITKSFNDGKSEIKLVADKMTLFAKGYLNLYSELTGKSVTGNLIRISTG